MGNKQVCDRCKTDISTVPTKSKSQFYGGYFGKVLFVGKAKAGKSSIIKQLVGEDFDRNYVATKEIDFSTVEKKHDYHNVKLQLWECGGTWKYQTMTSTYFRGAGVVVLVYDTSNGDMSEVERFARECNTHCSDTCTKIIVGNQIVSGNPVTEEVVDDLIYRNGFEKHMMVNASTGEGIDKLLAYIMDSIIKISVAKDRCRAA